MLLVEKFLLDGIFLLWEGWFCRTSFSTLVAQMWTVSTEASAQILYCTGELARLTCVQEFLESGLAGLMFVLEYPAGHISFQEQSQKGQTRL
jgi:hypothetical protein